MKLRVGGKEYPLDEALNHPKNRDVKYLIKASRAEGTVVSPATMQLFSKRLTELGEAANKPDADQQVLMAEFLSDEQVLGQLQGMVWLARRWGGEDLTYHDAGDFDMSEFAFISDDEEEEAPKDEAPADLG